MGRGRAKWWRSSWSLSLLLSNDCHGLLLGLENARRWRLTEAKKGTAPQHAAPARGLSTPGDLGAQWLEELASKGLLKRAAAGGVLPSAKALRIINELPVLLLLAIIYLVIAKPF